MRSQESAFPEVPSYSLLSRLATSATAELFDAIEDQTGRRFALKIAFMDTPGAETAARRMETEWLVGRQLRHPHLVRMFAAGRSPVGRFWIAMERLYGHDLRKEINRFERIHAKRTLHIALQLCQALEVLHRRGVVHRDIKPENVFLCAEGPQRDYVKLIDLGILSLSDEHPDRRHPTTGHVVIGTPEYLSPEQARGQRPDARADIYSLGVMMYHLMSGKLPFVGDLRQVLLAHAHARPPSLRDCGVDLPPALVDLIHRCLAKDPALRPASASALGEALLSVVPEVYAYYTPRTRSRPAQIPELPELHIAQERDRFAVDLNHWIEKLWPRRDWPVDVAEGLARLKAEERGFTDAIRDAELRRRRADEAAANRLERRARLEAGQMQLRTNLEDAQHAYLETTVQTMNAVERIEDADRRYGAAMRNLRSVLRRDGDSLDPAVIEETASELEQAYDLRQEGMSLEKACQERAATQADRLAGLRAEATKLAAQLTAMEVEEQTEGNRLESQAKRAQDEADAARHALEHIYLRFFLTILRASRNLR